MFGCPLNTAACEDEEEGPEPVRHEPPPDIGQAEAEAGLRQAIIRLTAHVGYHSAKVETNTGTDISMSVIPSSNCKSNLHFKVSFRNHSLIKFTIIILKYRYGYSMYRYLFE
jgi:hypothetical protein